MEPTTSLLANPTPAHGTYPVRRRRGVSALAATVAAALLAACGSDGPSGEASVDNGAASGSPVEVVAVDYAYVDLPAEVPAGTSFALRNDSDIEVHEFVAVLLPDDETRSVADLVQLPPAELGALFAGVQTVLVAPPGEGGFAVEGTGALDEAGRYAIVCVIPTGADVEEYLAAAAEAEGGPPEVAGGPPHIVQGMFAELTVTD